MHCGHCVRRYERESIAVEAVCIVSLNYGECDTATPNFATEWSLRVTATQLLKKRRHGLVRIYRKFNSLSNKTFSDSKESTIREILSKY